MRPWLLSVAIAVTVAGCGGAAPSPAPTTPAERAGHYAPPPDWHALAPLPARPSRTALADWAWACAAEVSTMRAWLTSQIVVDRQRKDIVLLSCHHDALIEVRAAETTLADRIADMPDTDAELALTARVFASACDRVRTVAGDAGSCGTAVIVEAPRIDVESGAW